MKFGKLFINKCKDILNTISSYARNNEGFNKQHRNANVGELVDYVTILRYNLLEPYIRLITMVSKIRCESLFSFVFRGKFNGNHFIGLPFARIYKKLFHNRTRRKTCLKTLSSRLNFFRGKRKIKFSSYKFFAAVYIIILVLFISVKFFTIKDINDKNYYLKLYDDLFSKGFWKSSIFKVFLFKGQNYVEDLMQYEGNSIFSFLRVIILKIIYLYNTYYLGVTFGKNNKTKKLLKNIKENKTIVFGFLA